MRRLLLLLVLFTLYVNSATPETYSRIDIEVKQDPHIPLTISGTTDLPDGSILTIGLGVTARDGEEIILGLKEKMVFKGKFFVRCASPYDFPGSDTLNINPCEAWVLFPPRTQEDHIKELVGSNGENLSGDLLYETDGGMRMLWAKEPIDTVYPVTPREYSFQTPDEFDPGTPERTLAEFCLAWKNQNWAKMVSLSQITWKSNETDPIGVIKANFELRRLKGFRITQVEYGETFTKIEFLVEMIVLDPHIPRRGLIKANVIKEDAPYSPSVFGTWGVNPGSCYGEIEVGDDIK